MKVFRFSAGLCAIVLLQSFFSPVFGSQQSIWADQWGSERNDSALGVAFGGGSAYVVGYVGVTNNNSAPGGCGEPMNGAWGCQAFLRKYDQNGNLAWSRQFGYCCFVAATGVAVNDHGIYVLGTGPAFLFLFDFNGNLVWNHTGPSGEFGYGPITGRHPSIAADNESVYAIANNQLFKYDLNGELLWNRQVADVNGSAVEVHGVAVSSGAIYVAGTHNSSRLGIYESFLTKYDSQGGELWEKSFKAGGFSSEGETASASSSTIYVGGTVYGLTDAAFRDDLSTGYVTSFDSNGNQGWTEYTGPLSGSPYSSSTDISATSADTSGVYFGATTSGLLNTTGRAGGTLIAGIDPAGNRLWTRQLTDSYLDSISAVALDQNGGAYFAGQIWASSVSNQLNLGGDDAFLIREPVSRNIPMKVYSRCANGGQGDNITCSVSIYGGTPPYSISWDFGDGTKGSGDIVSHIYRLWGNYAVTASVKDSSGTIEQATSQKNVVFQLAAQANLPFILGGIAAVVAALSLGFFKKFRTRPLKVDKLQYLRNSVRTLR